MRSILRITACTIAMPAGAQGISAEPSATPPRTELPVDEAGKAADGDEIVVTANRRQERLVDAPLTVNYISGEPFQKYNATWFDDVVRFVPGLDIADSGGRASSVSMRDVLFNPDAQTSDTVDIYLNEIPFGPTQAIQAQFDLDSIQVLRGPQGTLHANAGPSGAILLTTRAPDLSRMQANLSASYSDLKNVNLQGGIGIPIVPGVLAIRAAGLYDWNSGTGMSNIANGLRDVNRSYAGRLSVKFDPTPDLSFLVMHQEVRAKNERLMAIPSVSGTLGRFGMPHIDDCGAVSLGGRQHVTKGSSTIVNALWDMAGNRLTYLGSHSNDEANTLGDFNFANVRTPPRLNFVRPDAGNLAFQYFQSIPIARRNTTNELRFERTGEHFWSYRFGVYLRDGTTETSSVIDYTCANGACRIAPGPLAALRLSCLDLSSPTRPKSRSRGYSTTQTFNLDDRTTINAGLRYSTSTTHRSSSDIRTYDAWTARASARYRFSDAVLVYASLGQSFRPGGFDSTSFQSGGSGTNGLPARFYYWDDERSNAFEIETKGELFERRLTYAVSALYQKFKGFINRAENLVCTGKPDGQGPLLGTVYNTTDGKSPSGSNLCTGDGVINFNLNASASVRGVGVNLRAKFSRSSAGQLTVAYAYAKCDGGPIPCKDYNGDGVPDAVGIRAVQAGNNISYCDPNAQFSDIPKFQLTFNSDYTVDLRDGFQAYARGLGRYGRGGTDPTSGQVRPGYCKVDAFAGVKAPSDIGLGVFVRNPSNEHNDYIDESEIFELFGAASRYAQTTYDQRRAFSVMARANY